MNASSSSAIYGQLADALQQRLAVIADRAAYERDPSAHLRALQDASERIVALQRQLPSPVDAQLNHYLTKCSYDKALAWLREAPATGDT